MSLGATFNPHRSSVIHHRHTKKKGKKQGGLGEHILPIQDPAPLYARHVIARRRKK